MSGDVVSRLGIINKALDLLPAKNLTEYGQESRTGAVVRRWYPEVLGEMIESADWTFLIKRVALAGVTNDREQEWAYAFSKPQDLRKGLKILHNSDASSAGNIIYRSETDRRIQRRLGDRFKIIGDKLYCNIETPELDYITNIVDERQFSRRFSLALSYRLAAHIALPIIKSKKTAGELTTKAEVYWQRAVEQDANMDPDQSDEEEYISDTLAERNC